MTVTELIEHEDGSATITFDMTSEEAGKLLEYALVSLLGDSAVREARAKKMEEIDEQLKAFD